MTNQKFGLPDHVLKSVMQILSAQSKIRSVKLFGSRALGRHREGSDVDLAIAAEGLSHQEYLSLYSAIDDLMLPYKFDLLLVNDVDNTQLLEHIERVGIELSRLILPTN